MKLKAIVLFSGGLDSTTCLAYAVNIFGAENVLALSMQYGQKHSKEIECAEKIAKHYNVALETMNVTNVFEGSSCTLLNGNDDVPEGEYGEQLKKTNNLPVSTYVPFRNGLFIAMAASIAASRGYDVVMYGAHRDDAAGNAYPDCSEKFNELLSAAIYEGTAGEVEVMAPFIDKNKADIVRDGIRLGVPYEMTWSCYNGGEKPCGKCGTCIDRKKAFEANGIKDPLL